MFLQLMVSTLEACTRVNKNKFVDVPQALLL